jgi:hypothetical protein
LSGMIFALLLACCGDSFIADATAEHEFVVRRHESTVKNFLADIQLLRRHMPGVVDIKEIGAGKWLYRTERRMPLSDAVKTDFVIARSDGPDVRYQTPDIDASNWMSFRMATRPFGNEQSVIRVRIRVRLVRDDGAAIHMFAPVLGEAFISDRMKEDLEDMLSRFATDARSEIETTPGPVTVTETSR